MPRWFYMREENEYGPLNEEVIRTLMRRGKLDDDSQVKTEGEEEWRCLRDSALALPPSEEVEAALPLEPDIVPVPPVPEAGYTFMPPECAVSAVIAICLFTAEIVLLVAMLPSMIVGLLEAEGTTLIFLPDGMLLSRDGIGGLIEVLAPWLGLIVAIHLGAVIMWHSATADVPPLLGAEVVHFSAGSAWWWAVPIANLLMPLRAIRETWNLSRNPKSWSYGSMSTNPALMLWWGAYLAAVFLHVAQWLLISTHSSVRETARAEYLKGPKALLETLETSMWIVHLLLFIYIVVVIYRRQSAQLKGNSLPIRRRARTV